MVLKLAVSDKKGHYFKQGITGITGILVVWHRNRVLKCVRNWVGVAIVSKQSLRY